MTGHCLCGAVSITIETRPEFINDCNCSLCRKAGAAWGYFAASCIEATGKTVAYTRRDKPVPAVDVHSCEICAATTHFVMTDTFKKQNENVDFAGVNMRLFDPDALEGIEVRYPDGKAWDGEGAFEQRRPAMTIGADMRW